MVRHKFLLIATAAMGGLAALPAAAQFGGIFGGGPPRPPADVPQQQYGTSPNGDDRYFRSAPQQQIWTRDPRVVSPPPGGYPPPQYGYPQQGVPPPPGYPQQAGRPPGVQQQDLPPPPGGTAALPPGQRPPRGTPQPGAQPGAPADTPATPVPPQNEEVVIAPPAHHAAIVAALADVGAVSTAADALDAPVAVLDPTGRNPPVDIPLPRVGSASWQRLAP